ncbi:MAG: tetratricopeptide repeat protein [Sulfobacillus sp.]
MSAKEMAANRCSCDYGCADCAEVAYPRFADDNISTCSWELADGEKRIECVDASQQTDPPKRGLPVLPDDAISLSALLIVYFGQSWYQECLEVSDALLALWDSLSQRDWNYRGAAFYHLGRYEEAMEAYSIALGACSGDLDKLVLGNRALCLIHLAEISRAIPSCLEHRVGCPACLKQARDDYRQAIEQGYVPPPKLQTPLYREEVLMHFNSLSSGKLSEGTVKCIAKTLLAARREEGQCALEEFVASLGSLLVEAEQEHRQLVLLPGGYLTSPENLAYLLQCIGVGMVWEIDENKNISQEQTENLRKSYAIAMKRPIAAEVAQRFREISEVLPEHCKQLKEISYRSDL